MQCVLFEIRTRLRSWPLRHCLMPCLTCTMSWCVLPLLLPVAISTAPLGRCFTQSSFTTRLHAQPRIMQLHCRSTACADNSDQNGQILVYCSRPWWLCSTCRCEMLRAPMHEACHIHFPWEQTIHTPAVCKSDSHSTPVRPVGTYGVYRSLQLAHACLQMQICCYRKSPSAKSTACTSSRARMHGMAWHGMAWKMSSSCMQLATINVTEVADAANNASFGSRACG